MTHFFLQLVSLSKIISVMIVTVLILRIVLRKAPKNVHKILWLIVGIRACVPFYIKSNLGLIPAESVTTALPNQVIVPAKTMAQSVATSTQANMVKEAGANFSFTTVFAHVWMLGVVLFFVYMLFNYLYMKRLVVDAEHVKDNIYRSDKIPSPFVIGYFRPNIYILPEKDEIWQELIIEHERRHIKNEDHILKVLGFMVLGVYWFHPLMWLAYYLFSKDVELACDENVIRSLSFEDRKEYATALLESAHNANIMVYGAAFNENSVKERVVNIMNYKKPKFWMVLAAIVICISVLIVFFTVNKKEQVGTMAELEAGSVTSEEYVTYEFETFDGKNIVIDGTNIISQESVENVLETDKVPENAQIIAPGRDFVYLEDDTYYYVEDATKNLLTVATKANEKDEEASQAQSIEVSEYSCDDYSFCYSADSFYVYEDKENGSVTVSYVKEGVDTAGTNVMTFYKVEGKSSEEAIKEKVDSFGGNTEQISQMSVGENIDKAYVFTEKGESPESELSTVQTFYSFECSSGVILVDGFRTIGPNEETEIAIDAEFKRILQSFTCK